MSLPVRGAWVEITCSGGAPAAGVASLPVRGAWVEIQDFFDLFFGLWSLPVRGAWVEITVSGGAPAAGVSLPVRGAWVEIGSRDRLNVQTVVAPRAGSVG